MRKQLSLRARRTIIWKRIKYDWPVTRICRHFRINRDTFYYHWGNYQNHGWKGLEPKSRRPCNIHRTDDDIVKKILELREKEEHGPNKIEALLKRQNIHVGHSTIYRILKKHGLSNPIDKPRKTWGKTRFEREHINSLWQTDFKLTNNDNWMVTFLDDSSRFVVGCRINHEATSEKAIHLLEKSITKFGRPRQILSDRGAQFFCTDKYGKKQGTSAFTQFCIDNEIDHIVAGKRRPTTIGKVERFHRTYDEENHKFNNLRLFVHYYNFKRLHQSLGYLTPAEIYLNKSVGNVVS